MPGWARPTKLRVVAPHPPMSPLQNPNQKKRWENVDRFFFNIKMKMSAAAKMFRLPVTLLLG